MKYKEFRKWCNDRACDGRWSMENAQYCIAVIEIFKYIPFWKREKVWQKIYKDFILNSIVIPTNNIIANLKESDK